MKRALVAIAILSTLAVPAISPAAPAYPGPYMSGFLGINVNSDTNAAGTDFFFNKDFDDRVEFDPGISVGGTAGYDFGIVRLEGELSYKHAEIGAITDKDGFRFRNVDGNIGAGAMMFNGFFDLHNNSRITPYLGGGIGFAGLHLSDTTSLGVPLYGEADDTVFAYQLGAGVEIDLNRFSSLDIGYRYFVTDRATFDSDLDISTSLKFESHNATLGFRFKF